MVIRSSVCTGICLVYRLQRKQFSEFVSLKIMRYCSRWCNLKTRWRVAGILLHSANIYSFQTVRKIGTKNYYWKNELSRLTFQHCRDNLYLKFWKWSFNKGRSNFEICKIIDFLKITKPIHSDLTQLAPSPTGRNNQAVKNAQYKTKNNLNHSSVF